MRSYIGKRLSALWHMINAYFPQIFPLFSIKLEQNSKSLSLATKHVPHLDLSNFTDFISTFSPWVIPLGSILHAHRVLQCMFWNQHTLSLLWPQGLCTFYCLCLECSFLGVLARLLPPSILLKYHTPPTRSCPEKSFLTTSSKIILLVLWLYSTSLSCTSYHLLFMMWKEEKFIIYIPF